jgi:hypothetical protein
LATSGKPTSRCGDIIELAVDVSPVGLGENHLCGGNEHRAPLDPVLTAKEWNNSKSDVARWDENSKETYS